MPGRSAIYTHVCYLHRLDRSASNGPFWCPDQTLLLSSFGFAAPFGAAPHAEKFAKLADFFARLQPVSLKFFRLPDLKFSPKTNKYDLVGYASMLAHR